MQCSSDIHRIACSTCLFPLGLHTTPLNAEFTNMHQQLYLHFYSFRQRSKCTLTSNCLTQSTQKQNYLVEGWIYAYLHSNPIFCLDRSLMSRRTMLACYFFVCSGCTFVPCTRMGTRSSVGISCAFDKSLLKDKERQRVTCHLSLSQVPTTWYVWRQRVTCYKSVLRVTAASYMLQQCVKCYESLLCFTTARNACDSLLRVTFMYYSWKCIFFLNVAWKSPIDEAYSGPRINRIRSKDSRLMKNCNQTKGKKSYHKPCRHHWPKGLPCHSYIYWMARTFGKSHGPWVQ